MRRAVAPGMAIAVVACGESPPDTPPGVEVTDSAGIHIVTSPPRDAVHAELAADPALSIGLLDGPDEFLFGDIESVARGAEGNLIVADEQAHEIRVFDPRGRHVRSLGREGEAPGEFRSLRGAWPLPDGDVIALDLLLDRITRFDAEGAVIGTTALSSPDDLIVLPVGLGGGDAVLSSATSFSMPSRPISESLAISGSVADAMESMFGAESVFFLRHGLDGALIDTVATGVNPPTAVLSTAGSGVDMRVQMGAIPFSARPTATGTARGVAFTDGANYEVRIFDDSGAPALIARLDEAPPVRTDAHLETWVRNPGGRERDEAWIRERLARYRSLALPESLPAYTAVLFSDTGDIWARRYLMPGESMDHWDVFAPDGVHLGRVNVPTSFQIEEISRNQAVGIATDELGVERVQVRDLAFR